MATPEKKSTGGTATAPVASGTPGSSTPAAAPASTAVDLAAKHGGLPGGKPRKDGLTPGSPEAAAADREKDKIRKQASRAVAAQLKPEPPALPSAVPGATTAPAGNNTAAPGTPGVDPFVPWDPETIRPLVEDLLEAAEKGQVAQFAARCEQLGQMPKLIAEIKNDAHFPGPAKVLLMRSLPRLAAKYLNKAGISAEYQDEIGCLTAILMIVNSRRETLKKLDEIIASAEKGKERRDERTQQQQQQIFGIANDQSIVGIKTPAPSTVVRGQPIPPARPAPKGAPPEVTHTPPPLFGGAPQQIANIKQ